MRNFRKLAVVVSALAVGVAIFACGDDDDNVVRMRPEAGTGDGSIEGGEGGTLTCGVAIPTSYDSPNFAANAAGELALAKNVADLDAKMKSAEGAGTAQVSAAELAGIFTLGTPSLRFVATAAAQSKIDVYLTQFGDAVGKTWTPLDAETDGGGDAGEGGVSTGGKYEGANIFSATGVDLREGTNKILLAGALYNYALAIKSGTVTEATIDRLLALYGATPAFANSPDAGADTDTLIAAYASRRDNTLNTTPGAYRKIHNALLVAKAAASGGEKCQPELKSALDAFFLAWEKASFASVIFYLNAAATEATASPVKGPLALSDYGQAVGFIQSFRGIPQDQRKITDEQIDALLTRVGADKPYQLITSTSERVVAFNAAFQDIGAIYGMTPTEIEDAKKDY